MKRSNFFLNLKQNTCLSLLFILFFITVPSFTVFASNSNSICNDFEGQILDVYQKTPLQNVELKIIDFKTKEVLDTQYTDKFGIYKFSIPAFSNNHKIKIKISKEAYFSSNKYIKIDDLSNQKFELEKIAATDLEDFTAEKELIKELEQLNNSIEQLRFAIQKRTEQLLRFSEEQESNRPTISSN